MNERSESALSKKDRKRKSHWEPCASDQFFVLTQSRNHPLSARRKILDCRPHVCARSRRRDFSGNRAQNIAVWRLGVNWRIAEDREDMSHLRCAEVCSLTCKSYRREVAKTYDRDPYSLFETLIMIWHKTFSCAVTRRSAFAILTILKLQEDIRYDVYSLNSSQVYFVYLSQVGGENTYT